MHYVRLWGRNSHCAIRSRLNCTSLTPLQPALSTYPLRSSGGPLATANNLIEYTVLNVEEPPHRAVPLTLEDSAASTTASKPETDFRVVELEVARSSDLGCIDQTFFLRSHLGHLLKPGDAVMGYDLIAMTCTEETGLPDLVLVKKVSGAETGQRQRLEVAGRREDPTEEDS